MATTGTLLDEALRAIPPPLAAAAEAFRQTMANRSASCDLFVWSRDIKRGTHIRIDQEATPTFPPPMDHGTAHFFVCDSESSSVVSVYAASTTFVRAQKPKLGRFFMIPIQQLNDVMHAGVSLAHQDDAMDIDGDVDPSSPQPTPSRPPRVGKFRWMPTHPFCQEAQSIERVMATVLGDEYEERLEGPLKAYLQLLKEALAHLVAPDVSYPGGYDNFLLMYEQNYRFWTASDPPKEFPAAFHKMDAVPTMEETRLYLFKRMGYLFEEATCNLICKADVALCGFQNFLMSMEEGCDPSEVITAAVAEFEDFVSALQKTANPLALVHRSWWREVTVRDCLLDGGSYQLPFELALLLNTVPKAKRWPGLIGTLSPPRVLLSGGCAVVDANTMLLFVLPILRGIINAETLQINRSMYYEKMGERDFRSAARLERPTRIKEAQAREFDSGDAHFYARKPKMAPLPEDFVDASLLKKTEFDEAAFPVTDPFFSLFSWTQFRIHELFEYLQTTFLLNFPKQHVHGWRFSHITQCSPSLKQEGMSSFWFDRKYATELIRRLEASSSFQNRANFDGWRTGDIARMVPDIEDFASDGKMVDTLPPCLRALANLTAPKKSKGPSHLQNSHRLGAANAFLRIGYPPEDVIAYMSDGSSKRTAEAQGVVMSHISKYFNGGDFVTANEMGGIKYACETLVKNAKTSPGSSLHCPYAAKEPSLDLSQAVAKCSCDNLPNYAATQRPMPVKHPIFLLWKRLSAVPSAHANAK